MLAQPKVCAFCKPQGWVMNTKLVIARKSEIKFIRIFGVASRSHISLFRAWVVLYPTTQPYDPQKTRVLGWAKINLAPSS